MVVTLWCYPQQPALNELQTLDEIVVIDTKSPKKRSESGKNVITVSNAEIVRFPGQSLVDLLNRKAGINLIGSWSHPGTPISYGIRGGQARQVLILINGLPIGDPSSIEQNYDLRFLDLNAIDSIEIIKGASSVIYGNRASTAVINIRLKARGTDGLSGSIMSAVGSSNATDDTSLKPYDFQFHIRT